LLACVNRMTKLKGSIKKCTAEESKTAWRICKEGWSVGPRQPQYSTYVIITNFTEIEQSFNYVAKWTSRGGIKCIIKFKNTWQFNLITNTGPFQEYARV
jgi:hypothetical protein